MKAAFNGIKKAGGFYRALICTIILSLSISGISFADEGDYLADGFWYKLRDDGTAYITEVDWETTELHIPEEVNGHTITGFSGTASSGSRLMILYFPKTIRSIDMYSLSTYHALYYIEIAEDNPYLLYQDSIIYNRSNNHMIGYFLSSDLYAIPVFIDDLSKPRFAQNHHRYTEYLPDEITLPDGIRVIEGSAFCCAGYLRSITIPESVYKMHIPSGNLRIYLPRSVKSLNHDGLSSAPTLMVYEGSYAEEYCKKYDLPYEIIPDTPDSLLEEPQPVSEEYMRLFGIWEIKDTFPGEPNEIEMTESTMRTDNKIYNVRYTAKNIEVLNKEGKTTKTYQWKITNQSNLELTWKTRGDGVDDDVWDSHTATYRRIDGEVPPTTLSEDAAENKWTTGVEVQNNDETGTASVSAFHLNQWVGDQSEVYIPAISDKGYPVTEISGSVFHKNKVIRSVYIPEGIQAIGRGAFSKCENLASVRLPSTLRSIGAVAFGDCPNITEVVLPEGLEEIGDYVFSETGLTDIRIPDSVRTLGERAFWNCRDLRQVTLSSGLEKIEKGLFKGDSLLTEIVIPEGVREIQDEVFSGCTGLTSVTLPSTLVSMKDEAIFADCPNLLTIYAPENSYAWRKVQELGYGHLLTAISVPESRETETSDAGSGSVGLPENADQYACNEQDFEWSVVRENDYEVQIDRYIGESPLVRIPDTIDGRPVVKLNYNSFRDQQHVSGVIFGTNIRMIETGAFSRCVNLTDIFLNDRLESIGQQAFSECSSLRTITFPASLKKLWGMTFSDCENLESVRFDGVLEDEETIILNGQYAPGGFFNGCRKLREVVYPNDHLVFRDRMLIAQSETTSPVLISYTGMEDGEVFTVPEEFLNSGINQTAFAYLPLTELVFPDTELFQECKLTLWNVRADKLYLGSNILLEQILLCSELSEIAVSPVNRCGLYTEGGVLFSRSGDEVKLLCYPPKMAGGDSYQVPEGVTVIAGWSGFSYSSLSEIRLSGSVRAIEQGAVNGMNNLKDIYVPDSVTEIGLTIITNDCVFHTVEGSAADKYCKQRKWNVVNDLSPQPTPAPTTRQIDSIIFGYTLPEGHILHRGYEDFRAGFSLELYRDGTLKSVEEMAEGNEVYYGTWTKEGNTLHLSLPKLSGLESTIRISGNDWSGTFYNTKASGKMPGDADTFFEQAAGQPSASVSSEPTEAPSREYSQTPDEEYTETIEQEPALDQAQASEEEYTEEIEQAPAQESAQWDELPAATALAVNPLIDGKRQVPVSSVRADSYITGSKESYPPENMVDGDETTSWQFSTKQSKLKETYVYFSFPEPVTIDELWIKNGFWKITSGKDQYTRNSRIKELSIAFLYADSADYADKQTIKLKDDKKRNDWQKIELGAHQNVTGIRFRIMSIYQGSKFKHDVCVSEVMFMNSEQ